jgi:hypothetical protein
MFAVNVTGGGAVSARRTVMPGTVRFHRVLTAPPAAGVEYRMSFTNLSSGKSHNFGGE